jgi:hypothetical protein
MVGQRNKQKTEIALFPMLSPIDYHSRKNALILFSEVNIRFALIPDNPTNPKRNNRIDHSVEKQCGIVVGVHSGSFECPTF